MRYFVDTPLFSEDNMYARAYDDIVETRIVGESGWSLYPEETLEGLVRMRNAGCLEEVTEVPFND